MNLEQKRAALAVVLSGIVLFSWQYFYGSKQTVVNQKAAINVANDTKVAPVAQGDTLASKVVQPSDNSTSEPVELTQKDTSLTLSENNFLQQFKSTNALIGFSELFEAGAFKLFAHDGSKEIPLKMMKGSEANSLRLVNSEAGIDGTLSIDETEKIRLNISSVNAYRYLIKMKLASSQDKNHEKRFVTYTNSVNFYSISSKQDEGKISWLGLDYNYHLFAFIFGEKVSGKINITDDGHFTFLSTDPVQKLSAEMVLSRKDYDKLSTLGSNLEMSVDFGILGIIAVPILRGLQFLYKYIPNYGIGIILLTLLMRLITFPLQYKSFVSMKRMQKIQPELNKLREKYKEDPQRMQKETMDLFKKAGANPLGGCLPMLAQMPIFFAFYKVLQASVELVGAPFYFWIHDLSLKDPFFVLPILMTGLMFLQQKLTPSGSADPTQKKIMLLMPLIFGFIMKDLPSGLVLYICVSTVVGIIQQMLVFRAAE